MTDWSDPQTLWVNLTNLGLGLVTLVCLVVVGVSIARELLERARVKARAAAWEDDHAFALPGLGWTMADGGERKKDDGRKKSEKAK
jgi:hypothetical protein